MIAARIGSGGIPRVPPSDRRWDPVRKGQGGMAIVMALFFMVVAGVFGFVSYQKVKQDVNETSQNVKLAKSKFASEAAAYMGLGIANPEGATAPACVTHTSGGKTPATGSGSCQSTDLTPFERIYAKGALTLDSKTGWLTSKPSDTAEALTGNLKEKLEIKIWQPTPASVRVVGRATVNGITTDMQLFGEWTL
jgi:hypothetical protein